MREKKKIKKLPCAGRKFCITPSRLESRDDDEEGDDGADVHDGPTVPRACDLSIALVASLRARLLLLGHLFYAFPMRFHHFLAVLFVLPFLLLGCGPSAPGDTGGASSSASSAAQNADMIRVTDPQPNAVVSSPLTVKGEARGNWYFEASFPVQLLDENGSLIIMLPAQAEGEWMTTEFVPFSVTLNFETDAKAGTLVLMKDNPSGLPENAAEVRVPVKFE